MVVPTTVRIGSSSGIAVEKADACVAASREMAEGAAILANVDY